MTRNDTVIFGNFKWQILDIKDGKTLIITKDIIELRWYHTAFSEITWADCEIRRYLNDDFYNTFSHEEKSRISTTVNRNPGNPWFSTRGGVDTVDRIFLLSLEEVCGYFGNSMTCLLDKGDQKWSIDDDNNGKRQAKYQRGFHWWRLRSPGYYGRTSASVSANGNVYVRGNGVHGSPRDGGGVRPALWLADNRRGLSPGTSDFC